MSLWEKETRLEGGEAEEARFCPRPSRGGRGANSDWAPDSVTEPRMPSSRATRRMPLMIRPATDEDRVAIARMAEEVVHAGDAFVYRSVDLVLGYWYAEAASIWIAEEGGDVAGTYVVKPNQPDRGAHVANAGYMVAATHRRAGVGRRLGEHSIETARGLGYTAMQFNMVVASNRSAVRLWEDLGFAIVGTLPEVFRHTSGELVDAYVMHRRL